MKFPNAYSGIKKIITAEIFSILAVITGIASVVLGVVGYAAVQEKIEEILDFTLGGFTVFGLVTLLFLLLSFIFNVVGLGIAGKDDSEFTKALFEILLAVAAFIVPLFIKDNEIVNNVCSAVTRVIDVVVMLHVINGIANLGEKLFNSKIVDKGRTVATLVLIAFALTSVSELCVKFLFKDPKANINVILSIAAAVFNLIKYIAYLIYLGSGKRMLKKA